MCAFTVYGCVHVCVWDAVRAPTVSGTGFEIRREVEFKAEWERGVLL